MNDARQFEPSNVIRAEASDGLPARPSSFADIVETVDAERIVQRDVKPANPPDTYTHTLRVFPETQPNVLPCGHPKWGAGPDEACTFCDPAYVSEVATCGSCGTSDDGALRAVDVCRLCLDAEKVGREAWMERANRLSDEAGKLATERDELLRENATLRRRVEHLERVASAEKTARGFAPPSMLRVRRPR